MLLPLSSCLKANEKKIKVPLGEHNEKKSKKRGAAVKEEESVLVVRYLESISHVWALSLIVS